MQVCMRAFVSTRRDMARRNALHVCERVCATLRASCRTYRLASQEGGDADSSEDEEAEAWLYVRNAQGSMAGEPWRLKQALSSPARSWQLLELREGDGWFEAYRETQTYDAFLRSVPFRPNTTNGAVDVVLVGDAAAMAEQLRLDEICRYVGSFLGCEVTVRGAPVPLGPWAQPRKSLLDDDREQVGGHFVLAQLQHVADTRSMCTVGLTGADLYPPKKYHFVTGLADATRRVGVFSYARYFEGRQSEEVADELCAALVKTLSRECLKLCGVGECRLLRCLMNPTPAGPPERVRELPLELCCVCLRKLQWLTQSDLLDRLCRLREELARWFPEEVRRASERMTQVGLPTIASLSRPGHVWRRPAQEPPE